MPQTLDILKRSQPVFMGIFVVFAIIEGAITSYLTSKNNSHHSWPSNSLRDRTRFLVFVSWWTVVMGAAYIAFFFTAAMSFLSSIASHVVFIFITWVFWMAGVASLTDALGGGQSCGSSSLVYCSQFVAAEAFGWIQWIIMTFYFIILAIIATNSLRSGDRLSESIAA